MSMEKLTKHQNGQWTLKKSEIDKTAYTAKHRSTHRNTSIYTIKHRDHGPVGHATIDHSSNVVNPSVKDKFNHHMEFIGRSVKAAHAIKSS